MSLAAADGLIWIIACLLPLVWVQRKLHWEMQAVFLLLTRRATVAYGLFSFLFFPGVLLHEASHYLMARLLGVRTGRFSLVPQLLDDGRLRLGYVETVRTDPLRDSLVGAAPLISGGLLTAYLGAARLGLAPLAQTFQAGAWPAFWRGLAALPNQPDFWLWFYLAFTISTTMLPSSNDRESWLPLGLVVASLVALALVAGAGPWMLEHLAPQLNRGFRAAGLVFGISLGLHAILLLPVWLLRRVLNRLTGYQVV